MANGIKKEKNDERNGNIKHSTHGEQRTKTDIIALTLLAAAVEQQNHLIVLIQSYSTPPMNERCPFYSIWNIQILTHSHIDGLIFFFFFLLRSPYFELSEYVDKKEKICN